MAEPITPNIGKVYFLKSGLQRDNSNLDSFHPASTGDINKIHIFLEDGVSSNLVEMNYKRVGVGFPTSEQFPMRYVKAVSHMISGENFYRTFAMYEGFIPSPVSMWNANGRAPMSLEATITQLSGESLLGNYEDYSSLINSPEAQELEDLYVRGVVAYVYESSTYNSVAYNDGFYMVYDNGGNVFTWERIEIPITHIEGVSQKQYNVTGITLQKGNVPTTLQRISLSQEYISFIMRYLASVQKIGNDAQLDIDNHKLDVDNPHQTTAIKTPYVNTVSGLVAQNVQNAIDELDGIVDNHIGDKNNPHEVKATQIEYEVGQTVKQEIDLKADITYVDSQDNLKADITYVDSQDNLKADITYVDTEVRGAKNYTDNSLYFIQYDLSLKEDLSNKSINLADVNDIKYPTTQAVKTETDKKVNKTQTIIGIDLQDNILIGEFKTALGNATQSVAGLLSAEDKTHLDGLVALLESSDGNNVVDTIGEILEIFNNYPEGADLVSVLNDKVDKVLGYGLSENDLTDLLKSHYDTAHTHSQVITGNPHEVTAEEVGAYDKAYVDTLATDKGLKQTNLTLTPMVAGDTIANSILLGYDEVVAQIRNTTTKDVDTDIIIPSISIVKDNIIVLKEAEDITLVVGTTQSSLTGGTAGLWELVLIGKQYTNLNAIDVKYDNTDSGLTAENVKVALDELQENKAKKYLNQPIAELDEHTLNELFENGDTLNTVQKTEQNIVDWSASYGTLSLNNGNFVLTANGDNKISVARPTLQKKLSLGKEIYQLAEIKIDYRTNDYIGLEGYGGYINKKITSAVSNNWYFLSSFFTGNATTNDTALTTLSLVQSFNQAGDAVGSKLEVKYVYEFDISYLKDNQIIAPMYNLTFDNLTNEQIELQLKYAIEHYGLNFPLIDFVISQEKLDYYYDMYNQLQKGELEYLKNVLAEETISKDDLNSIFKLNKHLPEINRIKDFLDVNKTVFPESINTLEKTEDYIKVKGFGFKVNILSDAGHQIDFFPENELYLKETSVFGMWLFVEDSSKLTSLSITIYKNIERTNTAYFSASTIGGLKTGWNLLRWNNALATYPLKKTDRIYGIRITGGSSAATFYVIDDFWVENPEKAKVIFIDDGSYPNFYEKGYPGLKQKNIPCTWALAPGRIGGPEHITKEQILEQSLENGNSITFHSWSGAVTNDMTVDELRDDAYKCVMWLRERGYTGGSFRGAFTQNLAPHALETKNMFLALPMYGGGAGLIESYPFINPYGLKRYIIHAYNDDHTILEQIFEDLKSFRGTAFMYTHKINTGLDVDCTTETWNKWLSLVENGVNDGWLDAVTFEDLIQSSNVNINNVDVNNWTEKLYESEPYGLLSD